MIRDYDYNVLLQPFTSKTLLPQAQEAMTHQFFLSQAISPAPLEAPARRVYLSVVRLFLA